MLCDLCENSVLCVLIKPLGRRVREEDIENTKNVGKEDRNCCDKVIR